MELEFESVRNQYEEESAVRLELERTLVKARGDLDSWRAKYETEAAARSEEIEELRWGTTRQAEKELI